MLFFEPQECFSAPCNLLFHVIKLMLAMSAVICSPNYWFRFNRCNLWFLWYYIKAWLCFYSLLCKIHIQLILYSAYIPYILHINLWFSNCGESTTSGTWHLTGPLVGHKMALQVPVAMDNQRLSCSCLKSCWHHKWPTTEFIWKRLTYLVWCTWTIWSAKNRQSLYTPKWTLD